MTDRLSSSLGPHTHRMLSGIEALERSRDNLREDLTDVQKELNSRIEKVVDVSRQQAEILSALIARVDRMEASVEKGCTALFGTEAGKEGLLLQFRSAQQVARILRWLTGTIIAVSAIVIPLMLRGGPQ